LALFAVLAMGHSAAFLALGHDVQFAGLARETVKYVGFAANVAMLAVIFQTEPMDRAPPHGALALAAIVIGLSSMAFTWTETFYLGGSYVTVIGAVLTVNALLLVGMASAGNDRGRPLLTAAALAAALLGTWLMWSKLFLLCTAACALIFVMRAAMPHVGQRASRTWLAVAVGSGVLALLVAWLYISQGWRIESSASVRLNLWGMALDLAARSFPWGIGLGQFGAWLADLAPYMGDGQPRFVHNQFLAFVTETGAVGIVLSLIILKLVADAASAWRGVMRALFVCIVLGSLMLHDGIGLRALQLLLGYSFAVAVRPGASGSQRHRFA
jgi:hypothetical protein